MPEYLAPGVYVEEVSFRSKSIEGVSTTTTGFVGPTRYGPTTLVPQLLTSLGEFERIYGDGQQLQFADPGSKPMHNFVWHAMRAYFEEGGKAAYVSRGLLGTQVDPGQLSSIKGWATPVLDAAGTVVAYLDQGQSYAKLLTATAMDVDGIHIRARFPGTLGNMRVRLTLTMGQNLLGADSNQMPVVASLQPYDIVWLGDFGSPLSSVQIGTAGAFFQARQEIDPATNALAWYFYDKDGKEALRLSQLVPDNNPARSDQIRVVTATLTVIPNNPFELPQVWAGLPLDPAHQLMPYNTADSLFDVFAEHTANSLQEYRLPVIVTTGTSVKNGLHVLDVLAAAGASQLDLLPALVNTLTTDAERSFDVVLVGGNDGLRPTATEYAGVDDPTLDYKTGLKAFEDLDDISTVAAPGSTYGFEGAYHNDANTIVNLLITHATLMRYRIAVLDAGDSQTVSMIRAMRGKIDSKYAALYYPWIKILDPITRREIYIPPSGSVAGIYARNDINRGVFKAPANEVVNVALGFEILLNKAQQDLLNPEGVNCFRFFEGRGFRLWGARTISSDPEWKYVNLRRYFAYLEHSIDRGTQWAVFEPNGEALWGNIRRTIEDFLYNEWAMGALLGDKPEKAFFVKCDRTTMTQNDLDNGRLVCLIGVAPLRPAEYVIFRIGQWTADASRKS